MTRSTTSLHRHLLTRSDLALLEVPAGDVLAWLADGAIEQIGDLAAPGEPVFMVPSSELRRHLASRLAEIGKPTVVLTPLRVRSFLMRALLGANTTATAVDATETPRTIDDLALVESLQAAAAEIEADVEAMLQLAAEESQLEQESAASAADSVQDTGATDAAAPTTDTPTADAVEGVAVPAAESEPATESIQAETSAEAVADEECFEFDDLASALDALLPESPPTTPTPAPTSVEPREPSPNLPEPAADECPEAIEPMELPGDAEASTTEPMPTETTMPVETEPTQPSEPIDEEQQTVEGAEPERLPTGAEIAAVLDMFETGTTNTSTPAPDVEAPAAEFGPEPDAVPEASAGPATQASTATAEPELEPAVTPAATAVDHVTSNAIERVESFLVQLKETLVELAQRPVAAAPVTQPPAPIPPFDVAPLVEALQLGFERSNQQAEAAHKAIASLGEHVAALAPELHAIAARPVPPTPAPIALPAERPVAGFVVARASRAPVVMLALAAMVVAWSVLFWVKTGSTRLALGTLIGGNLVACSMLAFGRQR
jgi:hypothetical protein